MEGVNLSLVENLMMADSRLGMSNGDSLVTALTFLFISSASLYWRSSCRCSLFSADPVC